METINGELNKKSSEIELSMASTMNHATNSTENFIDKEDLAKDNAFTTTKGVRDVK